MLKTGYLVGIQQVLPLKFGKFRILEIFNFHGQLTLHNFYVHYTSTSGLTSARNGNLALTDIEPKPGPEPRNSTFLVNLISKDVNLVFYLSVYRLVHSSN